MEADGFNRLCRRLQELDQLTEAVPLGVFRMTPDRAITYANGRFGAMFGLAAGDRLPPILDDLDERDVAEEFRRQLDRARTADRHVESVEFNFVAPDTSQYIHVHLVPVIDADGEPQALGFCEDITERHTHRADLLAEARTDSLSGLANRTAMREFFDLHPERWIAVLMCDLDGFKQVNDTHGHAAGDSVIRSFAERLRAAVRPTDLVARVGGDEFVVVAPGVRTYDDATLIAERLHPLFRLPIGFEEHTIELSATIGVALGRPGDDISELLRLADHAMYEAKHSGRDRIMLHRPDRNTEALTPIVLRRELRRALEEDELHLELQPIVRLDGEPTTIEGEALLRWNHKSFGRISPAHIIPVAEQTGMIRPLGRFTIDAAARAAATLSEATGEVVRVGCNLSATQISDPELLPAFTKALSVHGLVPEQIPIELTESHRVHEVAGALDTLHELVGMGVSIVIDDFGAGVSTYEFILTLPVDAVKVDRVFTQHVTGRRGFEMLRSFAEACRNLDIAVVAEGIETHDQREAVLEAGIEIGQGFLFSPPVPVADFVDALMRSRDVVAGRPEAA